MPSQEQLREKMIKLNIKEEDLEESFVCSSGPGGQNVNKVATCVILRHVPSGIQVKCQKERSQYQNRLAAREMLIEKIEHQSLLREEKQKALRARLKRLNRSKPAALKEEILRAKKIKSEKKIGRKKILIHKINRDD